MTYVLGRPNILKEVERLQRRIYNLERRISERDIRHRHDVEIWLGSTLPTTGLREGRLIYAVALTNTNFGPNGGKRLYRYGEAPIGITGPSWRLVTPIVFSGSLIADVVTNNSVDVPLGLYFNNAPCPVDVQIIASGESVQSPATTSRAASFARTASGSLVPLSTARELFFDAIAGRIPMSIAFHESRPAGDDISYALRFYSAGSCGWPGETTAVNRAWRMTVTLT